MKKVVLALIVVSGLLFSCKKSTETNSPDTHPYVLTVPAGFPELPIDVKLTEEAVLLGRYLYYDTLLSSGGPHAGRSCSSCHLQDQGFTLPGQPVLAHCNLAWSRRFLWKGDKEGNMDSIMRFEVEEFFKTNIDLLRKSEKYKSLFEKAYGKGRMTSSTTANALGQFIATLVSGNSSYDQYIAGKANLSEEALRGMDIFFSEKGDCFHCHTNGLFTDNDYHNNGLKYRNYSDMGRYLVTGNAADIGKFKTPSLRNTALRGAYMHDGRYKTLLEVVRYYNIGVQHTEYLDPLLDKPGLGLTETEMQDLVSFLETLTDQTFLHHTQFSKP
jgi:cytochrome c peroxidase